MSLSGSTGKGLERTEARCTLVRCHRHVILLTDAHEAPAYELIEALRLAGVKTLIEGLREAETRGACAPPGT